MMWIAIIILILLTVLYLLALGGRTGHPGLEALRGWKYAHRGLHNETRPENSMSAFQAAKEHGYGVELDVHMIKDGTLVVFHDDKLIRVTGQEGRVAELNAEQLKDYHLCGTEETIPTFREVLDLFAGEVPLIIELKSDNGNCAALTDAVCRMLEDYPGVYCVESFDPRCVVWLRKNRPEIIRGQLAENFFRSSTKLPAILKWLLTAHLFNFLIKPDFVAYKFRDRNRPGTTLCRKLHKLQGVSWTILSQSDLDLAIAEGWIPIFEGFEP
jgi:glycerophosphoryl diester phosphodiesterase